MRLGEIQMVVAAEAVMALTLAAAADLALVASSLRTLLLLQPLTPSAFSMVCASVDVHSSMKRTLSVHRPDETLQKVCPYRWCPGDWRRCY